MSKYTITLSNDSTKVLCKVTVEAETERDAFLAAVAHAKSKGVHIPQEVWTHTKKHKDG